MVTLALSLLQAQDHMTNVNLDKKPFGPEEMEIMYELLKGEGAMDAVVAELGDAIAEGDHAHRCERFPPLFDDQNDLVE